MWTLRQRALALFLGWHSLAVLGSLGADTAPGAAVRRLTAPYERLLGVYQNWNMFAPNPPAITEWMEVEDTPRGGGAPTVHPGPHGPPPAGPVVFGYRRAGKFERTVMKANEKALRRAIIDARCARAAAAGAPLARVRFLRVSRPTGAPASAPLSRAEVHRRPCPP